MTSVVNVTAHCTNDKELVVRLVNHVTGDIINEQILRDGQSTSKVTFDQQAVLTFERLKELPEDPPAAPVQ